jgi:DNA-binding NarL/FixJ family response regulator
MGTINLAIVEDDKIIRDSLHNYLSQNPRIEVTFVAGAMETFLNTISVAVNPKLDVVLLDIGLPGITGVEGIRPILKSLPNVNIIILTTYEEEDKIFKALCAGAVSYLSKRTPLTKIEEAICTVYDGGSYMSPAIARKVINHFMPKPTEGIHALTTRQKQIADCIVEGLSYKMIADKLLISIDTVRDHIKKIYRLLNINSKTELIKKSYESNLK